MEFGFIQPTFFWALAALAIPVVVHLAFKRRSRLVELGTLRFLKIVVQRNQRWRNLKRWLLLALRLASIALLVGLFARPYLPSRKALETRPFLVVLIDQSASMSRLGASERLIDQALDEVRQLVASRSDTTDIRVAFFDQTVHPLELKPQCLQQDSQQEVAAKTPLQELITAPETLTGATNFSAAMAWARDACLQSHRPRQQIVILTDLQRSGLAWTETASFPNEIHVHVMDFGQSQTTNAAIIDIQMPSLVVRPDQSNRISIKVFNAGPGPLEKAVVNLQTSCGEHQFHNQQLISLAPNSSGSVEFTLPELQEGLWQGHVLLEQVDDLSFDNKRWFAFKVANSLPILIVDGQPHELPQRSASYYLNTCLRLAPPGETTSERLFNPTVLSLEIDTRWPDLQEFALVALANVPVITNVEAAQLSKWVRAGGGLLVFAGEPTTAEGLQALVDADLGVGRIHGFVSSSQLPWRWESWQQQHPIFQPFGELQRDDLARIAFRGITRLDLANDASVVAQFTGSVPAVVERTLERGRIIWFNAGCDGHWSDWPRSRLFLPLNYQLLSYLGRLLEGGPVQNEVIDGEADEILSPGFVADERVCRVINISPRESETDRCTKEEFAKRFGITLDPQLVPDDSTVPTVAAGTDLREDECWHLLLFALMVLILIEGFVANRTVS